MSASKEAPEVLRAGLFGERLEGRKWGWRQVHDGLASRKARHTLAGSLVCLSACTGTVEPGTPLEQRMEEAPVTAADGGDGEAPPGDAGSPTDAGLSCTLPDEGRWLLQLTRDSGSCEESVVLEMWAAGEMHVRFAGAVGHGLFQRVGEECVLTYDVTLGDMRVIGYVEREQGRWIGNASGSRSVYEHRVLGGCSALYVVAEAATERPADG